MSAVHTIGALHRDTPTATPSHMIWAAACIGPVSEVLEKETGAICCSTSDDAATCNGERRLPLLQRYSTSC